MPIPKSLHTVRVLTVMAANNKRSNPRLSTGDAVDLAAEDLGYHPASDDYGLIAKAVRAVDAGE